METFLVGGAVRDELLGLSVKDRDWVVVGATPDEMLRRGFKQVGADFPVFLHPQTREEYALARTERKAGRGYHGFTVYSAPDVTLEDDLRRRDLTINAMARSESGELVDPFHGQADLQARQLRHVSEAFAEDPLRILRTARFAARLAPMGFRVADDTLDLMRQMVADDEVDHLVAERVWQEIQRETFNRSLAALRCAGEQSEDTDVRFAALLSPLQQGQASARAKALKAPNECQDLVRLTTVLSNRISHQSTFVNDEEAVLGALDDTDAWRRPERFQRLLQALFCALPDARHDAVRLLKDCEQAATGVEAKALMAQGYKGKALGEAIRQERLQRIARLIQQQQA